MSKKKQRDAAPPRATSGPQHVTVTRDGFSNFAAALGTGADNLLNNSTYTFNFISVNRILLEAMYRTSWVVGAGVDVIADDMTQAGISIKSTLKPGALEEIDEAFEDLQIWQSLNNVIKWGRLYGTGMGILLIDGQDYGTPLRIETIKKGQFKGILACDRWQFTPSIDQLIKDPGPNMGMPMFYTMNPDALLPSLGKIHHSRIIRHDGLTLPHYQKQTMNLWSMSVIERLHDRLLAFDSTTVGAAQLVYKAYLRTWKIKDFRALLGEASGEMEKNVLKNIELIRRLQSNEGITVMDSEDEFDAHSYTFSGLDAILLQFGQQLAGALEFPLIRLFGQSPAGLNSTGDADLRTYYDGIRKKQKNQLGRPVKHILEIVSRSTLGQDLPPGVRIEFNPLWQLTETEKADIANKDSQSIGDAFDRNLITQRTAMTELRQSSNVSGRFSNITDDDIALADPDLPKAEEAMDPDAGGAEPGEKE